MFSQSQDLPSSPEKQHRRPRHHSTPTGAPRSQSGTSTLHSTSPLEGVQRVTGTFFAGASTLKFSEKSEFDHIHCDYDRNDDEDSSDNDPELPPRDSPSLSRSRKPVKSHSPAYPRGTTIDGEFFAGASDFQFNGTSKFNVVKGNKTKGVAYRGSRRSEDSPTVQGTHCSQPPPMSSRSLSSNVTDQMQGLQIEGIFFPGARDGNFMGKQEFNIIEGNLNVNQHRETERASRNAPQLLHGDNSYYSIPFASPFPVYR
jgi:hypothetical protein